MYDWVCLVKRTKGQKKKNLKEKKKKKKKKQKKKKKTNQKKKKICKPPTQPNPNTINTMESFVLSSLL